MTKIDLFISYSELREIASLSKNPPMLLRNLNKLDKNILFLIVCESYKTYKIKSI